ncbi:hypothetical protein DFH08DRAFT_12242 [Mycena albidolilacea]|uniref:Uncharacterized protein n=1 Tax=Mycena albidolilacea TaxID=1033008 RepID=A0AAD7AU86_9AGAR|nr:hypothetical protein DFH08DRAFT_12242 [Mycena albidolilacea]
MHKTTRLTEPGTSTARPKLARPDSELLASYYQSPLADQGAHYTPQTLEKRPTHRRSLSGDSTSSSDYSSSGSTSEHSLEEAQPATRRSSIPSEGGSDRRRLAIVQMDTVRESDSPTSPSAVRSRRGFETRLDDLALVAPPDAAGNLREYIHPPSSAPPTGSRSNPHPQPEDKGHNRSASEATSKTLKTKSSRDVGIVGTTSFAAALESPKIKLRLQTASESLLPPVFQEPHSRSSTPNTRASTPNGSATPSDARSLAPRRRSTEMSIHTPEIGQAKEIHVPVASPIVVNLGPDASLRVGNSSFDRQSPALQVVEPRPASPLPLSSYLHYQPGALQFCSLFASRDLNLAPGLHATAGPLPPPPRAAFSIDPSSPPPPRPPRLHSPPPRSPRRGDLDVVNQPLQLAVSAVLSGSSGSSTPSSTSRSISPPRAADFTSSEESNDETLHRREGAFSPSIISTTPSTSPSDYSPTTARPGRTIDGLIPHVRDTSKNPAGVGGSSRNNSNDAVSPPPMVAPPPRMESLPEQPNEEWTHISRDLTASPSPSSEDHVSKSHDRVSWESYSPPASVSHSQEGATPSSKTRAQSLGAGLKRFASLPRTPSPSSRRSSSSLVRTSSTSGRSQGSPGGRTAPLPPSSWNPNANYSHSEPHASLGPRQMPRRRKIVSRNPPALSSADIGLRKSALERCSLYAQKINELYMHDCGLSEWVVEARFRGSNGPKASTLMQHPPGGGPQPRHVSRSSIKSEATFPRRPDAMLATDLSTKPSDIAPAVPALPYPALSPRSIGMTALPSTSTMPMPLRMLASAASSSSSSSSSSKTSFFSSLGRKGSISKPNKPPTMASFSINNSASGTRLTKAPPMNSSISNPRPVIVPSALPSVPGGPRAPPNRGGDRALRTQSINTAAFSSNMADRNAVLAAKRPSLFAPPSSSSSRSSASPSRSGGRSSGTSDRERDREFEKQVDKLADLLPQAERDVLAGYLRRAGQDILAIGQYLEDEKNGVLRRD